jgi:transcription initiation factor TFIID TATA-box-binding protein
LSGFDVKVENVVAFVSLGKDIKLTSISNRLKDAEYSPDTFPGVIYRIPKPKTANLIFSSGKIVCTGSKSVEEAGVAVNQVVEDLRKLKIQLPESFDMRIENIVASTQIEAMGKLNLEDISFALENVEYEPEQFPGLVFRIAEPRVAFLLFGSGKIICTGARNVDDIHRALVKFRKKLDGIGVKTRPIKAEPKPEPDGKAS